MWQSRICTNAIASIIKKTNLKRDSPLCAGLLVFTCLILIDFSLNINPKKKQITTQISDEYIPTNGHPLSADFYAKDK